MSVLILVIILLTFFLLGELDNIRRYIFGVEEDVIYNGYNLAGKLEGEVENIVYQHAKQIVVYPKNASINQETAQVKEELYGQIIDITETVNEIFATEGQTEVEPVIYQLNPVWKKEDLEELDTVIAKFDTLIQGSQERIHNIKLATKKINNQLLLPDEIFSFNDVVGPRTKERGFAESIEIIDGEYQTGVGGGICQVSTTVYNAVDKAELEVIELYSHSKDVSYAEPGQDATVAWDFLDFKFKNNLKQAIIIKAAVWGGQVRVEIISS